MSPPLKSCFKRPYQTNPQHSSLYFKGPSRLDDSCLVLLKDAAVRLLPLHAKSPQVVAFQEKKTRRKGTPARLVSHEGNVNMFLNKEYIKSASLSSSKTHFPYSHRSETFEDIETVLPRKGE